MAKMERIVIKLGTSTIIGDGWAAERMERLITQIATLRKSGKEVILVSSGAIGLANNYLGKERSDDLVQNQVSASVGQVRLLHKYAERFSQHGITVGQLLLTSQDILNGKRRVVRNLLERMLEQGILPIINENDSISTEEITFGDNDLLSAYIAQITCADLLILLSDVDGLLDNEGRVVETVEMLDQSIAQLVTMGGHGKGGMKSKLLAAQVAASSHIQTIVANGQEEDILLRLLDGEELGTHFCLPAITEVKE